MKQCNRISLSLIFCFASLFVFTSASFAQNPPASQTAGGVLQQRKMLEEQKRIEQRVTDTKAPAEELATPEVIPQDEGEKVLITKIVVTGVTLIPADVISAITGQFEGKELSLREMQKVADLITDEYRKKGYVTSRAYIPPQAIRESILNLNVVEGRMGAVDIRGNRFFKTSLIRRKVELKPQGYFDFVTLQKSLTFINEHPDRTAKAVLAPGKEPGTTDVILEVKDRLPIHVGYNYDNYASRYLGERRNTAYLEHNNLLGFDDKLRFEWQQSRDGSLKLGLGRYVFPIKRDWSVGFYGLNEDTTLGRDFKSLDARGENIVWGAYTSKALVNTENLDLRWNTGFDYKDSKNFLAGIETSRDEMRIIKTGLDLDFNDRWARNIMTAEIDVGIPHIMGGMDDQDDHSSRSGSGSGAEFQKWVLNYFRLQPGPFTSEILFKNSAQISNSDLVAGEQFQVGGPGSVRGYPIGELAGDKGLYSSVEWTFPPYFVPRQAKVPFMKNRTIFESFRILTFYDWGATYTNTASAGEIDNRSLSAAGFGFRLSLGENFFARIEFGYPLSSYEPTDNKTVHPWFEITAKF